MINRTSSATLRRASSRRRGGERGSAYIVALLALVVLTIIGLSLTLVSQTEMTVGAVERTAKRAFYATDSAIAEATARAQFSEYDPHTFDMQEPDANPVVDLHERVEVSRFHALRDAACNLCEINNSGGAQGYNATYKSVNYAVTGTSTRIGAANDPRTSKVMATMMEVQPKEASTDALAFIDNPDELAKIRF